MVSALDDLGLRDEADIIRLASRRSIPLPTAEQYELWELAAAVDMDLIGTETEVKGRNLAEEKSVQMTPDYWQGEEGKKRLERIERAKNRKRNRKERQR
jgi:hypothetical protein